MSEIDSINLCSLCSQRLATYGYPCLTFITNICKALHSHQIPFYLDHQSRNSQVAIFLESKKIVITTEIDINKIAILPNCPLNPVNGVFCWCDKSIN